MKPRHLIFLLVALAIPSAAQQSTPQVRLRKIPPVGIPVMDADVAALEVDIVRLDAEVADLRKELSDRPALRAELPNVEIFLKAADWALRYHEFFDPKQVTVAKDLLRQGIERATALRGGQAPWNSATGLVLRGYRSIIDGSVQPYSVLVPDDFKPGDKMPRPLGFWCHGRNEKLSELAFLHEMSHRPAEFTPPGTFVVSLYGRFCCANKFAGERDLFEACEDMVKHYPVDTRRLVIRGFSMGGASCWQFATHFPGLWAAAAPGAGFAESREFLKLGTPEKPLPPPWEQVLWRWYDSTLYAANLANTTTVAYSGELDAQKQAADIMIQFLQKEGITIPHIIGPQTQHQYHPDSKVKINELVDAAVAKGGEIKPGKIQLITYSLIYPGKTWITLTGMEKQWERAEIHAEWTDQGVITCTTKNATALNINLSATTGSAKPCHQLTVDGQAVLGDVDFRVVDIQKRDGKWSVLRGKSSPLSKAPGLCGPVDHAFMSSFLHIRPTGQPANAAVGVWAKSELARAKTFWRETFRGQITIRDDSDLTPGDISNNHLILWGDPESNKVLARILDKLPLQWSKDKLVFAGETYDAAHHAPVLIFPNPLNPAKYVVLNSGPTFREAHNVNNAMQTPKLPDWAIVNLDTPPDDHQTGAIVAAGFFDEQWANPAAVK